VVQKITLSAKELWATEVTLKGTTGKATGLKLIVTGMWLSKFKPDMFLNQKVSVEDDADINSPYVLVKYVDYPLLKSDNWTVESASG